MKLGLGSYAYYWATGATGYVPTQPMTVRNLLEKAVAHGVGLVQIADNLPLQSLPAHEVEAIISYARANDLEIELGTRGIQTELLRTYLALADKCGSSLVRTVIDTPDHQPSPDEVVDALKAIVPDFEAAHVRLAIENHDRFRVRTLTRILERIGSDHVGICLDTVNSFGALEGPEIVVDVLGPLCMNLHIKDFCVRRIDHLMGFVVEGTPAGQGMLDVPWLLGRLRAQPHQSNAILELWPPPEPTLDATIAKEDRWVSESIAYLRQHIYD